MIDATYIRKEEHTQEQIRRFHHGAQKIRGEGDLFGLSGEIPRNQIVLHGRDGIGELGEIP
jgi:hypothetical protein